MYLQSRRRSNDPEKLNTRNILAQSNVAIQPKQRLTTITKYDLKSVSYQAKLLLNQCSHATFAQLLRVFSVVSSQNEWDIRKCYLVKHKVQVYPGSTPQFSLKFKIVQNASFVTHPNPSAKLRVNIPARNSNSWPLWILPDILNITC